MELLKPMIQYLICRVPFPAHNAFPIPQRAQPTCIHCARYLSLSILANIHHTYLDPARTSTSSQFFKSSKVVKGTWNDLGRISRGRSYSDNQRTIRRRSIYWPLLLLLLRHILLLLNLSHLPGRTSQSIPSNARACP
jgi:hypothetical protein